LLLTPDSLPHKYWRLNLKGYSKPEDPQDPYADRGFLTFGRLWGARFWVAREDGEVEAILETADRRRQTAADASDAETENGAEAPSAAVCCLPSAVSPFDSKPVPRTSTVHKCWHLTFTEPEVVTSVVLDVDQHVEHYIVAPGGRDAFGQDVRFI